MMYFAFVGMMVITALAGYLWVESSFISDIRPWGSIVCTSGSVAALAVAWVMWGIAFDSLQRSVRLGSWTGHKLLAMEVLTVAVTVGAYIVPCIAGYVLTKRLRISRGSVQPNGTSRNE